jgi:hypothetical protein
MVADIISSHMNYDIIIYWWETGRVMHTRNIVYVHCLISLW